MAQRWLGRHLPVRVRARLVFRLLALLPSLRHCVSLTNSPMWQFILSVCTVVPSLSHGTFEIELLFNLTYMLTHSLSIVFVPMMRSKELKTSRSILMPILRFCLTCSFSLEEISLCLLCSCPFEQTEVGFHSFVVCRCSSLTHEGAHRCAAEPEVHLQHWPS